MNFYVNSFLIKMRLNQSTLIIMNKDLSQEENISSNYTQNKKLNEYEFLIMKLEEIKDKITKLKNFLTK